MYPKREYFLFIFLIYKLFIYNIYIKYYIMYIKNSLINIYKRIKIIAVKIILFTESKCDTFRSIYLI